GLVLGHCWSKKAHTAFPGDRSYRASAPDPNRLAPRWRSFARSGRHSASADGQVAILAARTVDGRAWAARLVHLVQPRDDAVRKFKKRLANLGRGGRLDHRRTRVAPGAD